MVEYEIQEGVWPTDEQRKCLAVIDFKSLIQVTDFGVVKPKGGFLSSLLASNKRREPKWFALRINLTNEFLKQSTPEQIGTAIKDAYNDLQQRISEYEKHGV